MHIFHTYTIEQSNFFLYSAINEKKLKNTFSFSGTPKTEVSLSEDTSMQAMGGGAQMTSFESTDQYATPQPEMVGGGYEASGCSLDHFQYIFWRSFCL